MTPLVDEGADQEIEDADPEDEDEEGADEDDGSGIDEDGNDAEDEEEGGIEDGLFAYLFHLLACIFIMAHAGLNLVPAAIRRERIIRGIPQFRLGPNHEAIARSVVELANGIFRRRPVPMEIDTPFDPSALGLKEIGNLASWTVSSCKPGCGVEALRDEDTGLFWQ